MFGLMHQVRATVHAPQAGSIARDLEEVLHYPGVLDATRKAVLKALHRDSHPGLEEREARACDQRFQKANAVFGRIGGPG